MRINAEASLRVANITMAAAAVLTMTFHRCLSLFAKLPAIIGPIPPRQSAFDPDRAEKKILRANSPILRLVSRLPRRNRRSRVVLGIWEVVRPRRDRQDDRSHRKDHPEVRSKP